ncbi:MAG: hypothetical protein R3C11_26115 [Planctomycetaceae bacterium]
MSECQLYLDTTPHSGVWNMAMDEALLERAVHQGIGSVRIYLWELPTVSLGYFQTNEVHESLAHLPRVRRLTGGGAILHHHEITYSCTLPAEHQLADQTEELYEQVHAVIINYLQQFGVNTSMRGETVHAEGAFMQSPFSALEDRMHATWFWEPKSVGVSAAEDAERCYSMEVWW